MGSFRRKPESLTIARLRAPSGASRSRSDPKSSLRFQEAGASSPHFPRAAALQSVSVKAQEEPFMGIVTLAVVIGFVAVAVLVLNEVIRRAELE